MNPASGALPADYWYDLRVRGNQVDYHDRATAAALADWMIVAAGIHAEQLGISMNNLHSGGTAWALTRLVMNLDDMPLSEHAARLRTWPTILERLQFRRDFTLYDPARRVLARCASFWVIIDMETRRAIRMPQEYREFLAVAPELALEVDKSALQRLPLPTGNVSLGGPGSFARPAAPEALAEAGLAGESVIPVRRADLDTNRHVNSVRYVEWLFESLPQEIWENYRLHHLEILFRTEMRGGTAISRCAALDLPELPVAWRGALASLHAREESGESEVVRALMHWRPAGKRNF